MDLQKVAAQANAVANQRSEGAKEGAGMFATPFADMIRLPSFMSGGLFGLKSNQDKNVDAVPDAPKSADKPDNQRADNNDDDQRVDARDDAPDTKVRADDQADDKADDNTRRAPDDSRETASDEHDSDHADNEEAPQQANSEETGDEEITETDTSDSAENTDAPSDSAETGQGGVETASTEQSADVTISADVTVNAGFEPALESLLAAAHTTHTDNVVTEGNVVKEAAQVLRTVAAGPKAVAVVDDAGTANVTSEQARQQLHQQQQAQLTLDRVGGQIATNANDAAIKAVTGQPLVEQQAKALADTLKSDKPVKVHVNVDNQASTTVSQTNQSLNANAIAAQEAANAQNARINASRSNTGETSQQTPQARVDGSATIPGQTQALNQVAQNTASAAADAGLSRATVQISTAGPQASHGGGEGVNATAPGGSVNAQQTANVQRAAPAQTPQAPEQSRPLAHQISVNISKAVSEGLDRISIQLRPDNLGRVEVKLEVAQNGRVNATIIVDRAETLELLRNDSRNLERALQNAGLDTQSGDLTFNLRDQREAPDESQSNNRMAGDDDVVEDGNLEAEMAARLLNGDIGDIISDMRVDIRA